MSAELAAAARSAAEAVASLAARLSDPLVDVIEREMQLHFAHELDGEQLRAAARRVAHRVRARPTMVV